MFSVIVMSFPVAGIGFKQFDPLLPLLVLDCYKEAKFCYHQRFFWKTIHISQLFKSAKMGRIEHQLDFNIPTYNCLIEPFVAILRDTAYDTGATKSSVGNLRYWLPSFSIMLSFCLLQFFPFL